MRTDDFEDDDALREEFEQLYRKGAPDLRKHHWKQKLYRMSDTHSKYGGRYAKRETEREWESFKRGVLAERRKTRCAEAERDSARQELYDLRGVHERALSNAEHGDEALRLLATAVKVNDPMLRVFLERLTQLREEGDRKIVRDVIGLLSKHQIRILELLERAGVEVDE